MKTSCIEHISKSTLVIVRQDYVDICGDEPCAAAILNLFEFWTNIKLGMSEQAKKHNDIREAGSMERTQDEDVWVWKTTAEIRNELLSIWGTTKVETARKWLVEQGLILQRNNPIYKWDKTYQYKLDIDAVNLSLRESKNKSAIPETTTETTQREKTLSPQKHGDVDPLPKCGISAINCIFWWDDNECSSENATAPMDEKCKHCNHKFRYDGKRTEKSGIFECPQCHECVDYIVPLTDDSSSKCAVCQCDGNVCQDFMGMGDIALCREHYDWLLDDCPGADESPVTEQLTAEEIRILEMCNESYVHIMKFSADEYNDAIGTLSNRSYIIRSNFQWHITPAGRMALRRYQDTLELEAIKAWQLTMLHGGDWKAVSDTITEIHDNCSTMHKYSKCAAKDDNGMDCLECEWRDELPDTMQKSDSADVDNLPMMTVATTEKLMQSLDENFHADCTYYPCDRLRGDDTCADCGRFEKSTVSDLSAQSWEAQQVTEDVPKFIMTDCVNNYGEQCPAIAKNDDGCRTCEDYQQDSPKDRAAPKAKKKRKARKPKRTPEQKQADDNMWEAVKSTWRIDDNGSYKIIKMKQFFLGTIKKTSKKYGEEFRLNQLDERPANALEVVAFGHWYRSEYDGVSLPESGSKLRSQFESFRGSGERYETFMRKAQNTIREKIPKIVIEGVSEPPQADEPPQEIISEEQQKEVHKIIQELADGMGGKK